jgi:hypothetical protein
MLLLCLLGNGAYIGLASFDRIGDAGDMIRYGSPIWTLWAFGFPAVVASLVLFHRLGRRLGLGSRATVTDLRFCGVLAGILVLLSLILTPPRFDARGSSAAVSTRSSSR